MSTERLMTVVRMPRTSEKTTVLADKLKKYTFEVLKNANKYEIKQAVEHLFNVKVSHVTVMNVQGKKKRFKQQLGQRNDWKKAIVSLKPGSEIDLLVAE